MQKPIVYIQTINSDLNKIKKTVTAATLFHQAVEKRLKQKKMTNACASTLKSLLTELIAIHCSSNCKKLGLHNQYAKQLILRNTSNWQEYTICQTLMK